MQKHEIAGYLSSLHSLLMAQTMGQHSLPNTVLATEYEKYWDLLKDAIEKENEDEAG